ncbi:MAG TPA: hypothetical protein VM163_08810 [bacterium]|nr:hypothetical protein [bacterium]
MKAVKGIYENGKVRLLESMPRKEQTDVMVIFSDETEATAQRGEIRADALLRELDAIADSIEGEFDSAQDVQKIRRERADSL